jgi:hypothetical protein
MTDKPKYDMSGILFFQDDKDAENKPDWKGNITVRGEELELAGWIKQGKRGNFLTLKVSEKRRQDVSGTVPATTPRGNQQNGPQSQRAGSTRHPAARSRNTDMQDDGAPPGYGHGDFDDAPF